MTGLDRQDIVIAGSGAAPWMTAAALARSLDIGAQTITVVDTGDDPAELPFGLGDGTQPPTADFNQGLFPEEARLVAAGGSAWSFGIAMSGWSGPGVTYFHPFGSIGADLGPVSFPQVVQRLRQEGVPARLANYSLSALAAQAGRFQAPAGDARSVLSTCRTGLHVEAAALEAMEHAEARKRGVRKTAGRLAGIEWVDDGSIAALTTSAGERIEGALFIDCSGPGARLIGEMRGSRWEDWSSWLPCDRVLSAAVKSKEPPQPFSHAEAGAAGWTQYLPLQGRTVVNAVYNPDVSGDVEVFRQIERFAGPGNEVNAVSLDVAFGRRPHAWLKNCVALGAAAVLIDPVAISNLQLLRSGINRLASLLPGGADIRVVAHEYNRQSAAEYCHARDFALLHYRLNGRNGEPLWDAARKMAVPASLGYKLQLYANLGRVAMYDFEPLEEISWINLFDEHGVQPLQLHPIAEGVGPDELKNHAERIRSVMMETVRKMPPHAEYLSRVNAAFAAT